MYQIATMVDEVTSTRTVVLLGRILPELRREHVSASIREAAEQLTFLLSQATG